MFIFVPLLGRYVEDNNDTIAPKEAADCSLGHIALRRRRAAGITAIVCILSESLRKSIAFTENP
jgi:hypothetical protein